MSDMTRAFFEVNEDFLYSDYDVFVTDSSKEVRDLEEIRTLLQPAMQNGATLLDAAHILSSENVTQIKEKLAEIEERREQLMQQQSQMEQQQAQMEAELKSEELRIKEEDSIRDSQTDILVAEIQAASKESGEEGTSDVMKIQLDKEKIQRDAELKSKQINEDIRKNKVAEKQRQEEIAIKRKQANKPNKTK